MSWYAWLCLLLLCALLLAHRLACHYLPAHLLPLLRRRFQCVVPREVAQQLLPSPLCFLLPSSLLTSPLLAAVALSPGDALQVHWPLGSGLRALTVIVERPSFDLTLTALDDLPRPYENDRAGLKGAEGAEKARTAAAKAAPLALSSFQAVVLRWFRLSLVVKQARARVSSVSAAQ